MRRENVLVKDIKEGFSLGGNLDKLLNELDTFAECWTKEHFSYHPQLNLVAAPQQQLQRRRVATAGMAAECEVHQLLLEAKQDISVGFRQYTLCSYRTEPFPMTFPSLFL